MTRRDWDDPERMISVDRALSRIVSCFRALDPAQVPLLDALGLVLSEDVVAGVDVPPFRNSAMDGYALRAAETAEASPASPVYFDVVGAVAAGSATGVPVGAGQAARIMTGAAMPEGADTVVRFEETDESEQSVPTGEIRRISVRRTVRAHENVRDPGEDVRAGDCVLEAGTCLGPAAIGVLASLNVSKVAVHRRPRVAILSTGNEVRDLGVDLAPGQIRDSNSYALAAMVSSYGGIPIRLGIARDTASDLSGRLRSAGDVDLIVTSGGVSHGDYDMVKDVLQSEGKIDLWEVRMKPGKPLAFGRIGGVPLLGLPGNPAAALVSFEQFGRPAILKMLGHTRLTLPEVEARVTERIENRGRRRHFERAVLTQSAAGPEVRTTGIHGSAKLSGLLAANCFIVVPEDREWIEPGETVRVQVLDHTSAALRYLNDRDGRGGQA